MRRGGQSERGGERERERERDYIYMGVGGAGESKGTGRGNFSKYIGTNTGREGKGRHSCCVSQHDARTNRMSSGRRLTLT